MRKATLTIDSGVMWAAAQRLLPVLMALSLLLSLAFAARVPFNHNPDEEAHRDYVRLIVEERGFVQFIPRGEVPEGQPSRDEAHQPPLYYLLCVPVYAATGGSVFAMRLVAALLQLGTLYIVFRACKDLWPERPDVAAGATAFAAFLPTQAQLGGAINNDSLTVLLCAVLLWRLGALLRRGQDVKGALIVGAILGAGLWTKLSVLQLTPAMALAYFLAARFGKMTLGRAAGLFALSLGTALLIASPWLVRNTLLYGDPLTLGIYRLTGPNFTPEQIMQVAGWATTADYLRAVGIRSFATFWYFLDPNLPVAPLGRFVGPALPLLVVVLLALAGIAGLYQRWKGGETPSEEGRLERFYLGTVLLMVPFFVRFVLTVFQAQGRYFLPVLLPVAALTALGFAHLLGRGEQASTPAAALARTLVVPAVLLALALVQFAALGFMGGPVAMPRP
jgi:4-amino-4-deoxy-L-arabinose transferase and related glycosyltransferases of PMT family